MADTPSAKNRGGASKKRPTTPNPSQPNGGNDFLDKTYAKVKQASEAKASRDWDYTAALVVILVLAFATRFWNIGHPDQVVFDEVHFGKFASYYLQRLYFFDVHPPFGKLLFALAGWFVGYRGEFLFENIGDSYIVNKVPYVAYRSMPASLGSLTVGVVFLIMWESGYSLPACILSAGILLFDNAHIGQTRLILLDATLVFAMSISIYAYIKFYKARHAPWSTQWWKWLLLTGLALSCVISTKYIGVFTFISIGIPVAIDLWGLLDVNRKHGALSLPQFGKHVAARVFGLIVIPFLVYLFWFQVHFTILRRSGPGDDFMTPQFQATLSDNAMTANSVAINYNDIITIRHKETKVLLHSHEDKYPLRYDDGRISSQGQQVTGYPHEDTNNHWQILPTAEFADPSVEPVKNGDTVKLRHIVTNTVLLSHDVASPYYPTNQEFTTVSVEEANGARYNDTSFEIKIEGAKGADGFRTKASHFKLIHKPSRVAMWTHTKPLPEWAYKQAEINGNKNTLQSSNVWFADDVPLVPADDVRRQKEARKVKPMPFLKKWVELQRAMFFHNNALTASHPYASFPVQWPFLLRGVSFWTNNDTKQQIYFLGNPIGWWLASSLLAVFAGILGADQLSLRRGVDVLDDRTRSRLYNSTGFFFLVWAAHYFGFFVMGRQLFLHHYLPAHLASALVAGALLEFVFNVEAADAGDSVTDALSPNSSAVLTTDGKGSNASKKRRAGERIPVRERLGQQSLFWCWAATGAILSALAWTFFFFAPLTYGSPPLTVAEVNARKWLSYDLHFAK